MLPKVTETKTTTKTTNTVSIFYEVMLLNKDKE